MKKLIIFFEPPGAGKSTQASFLSERKKFGYVSWGQISREIMAGKSYPELKSQVTKISLNNLPFPKNFIKEIIQHALRDSFIKFNTVILDGYPRRDSEARELIAILKEEDIHLEAIIGFNISLQTVLKRVSSRMLCTKCGKFFTTQFGPNNFCVNDGTKLVKRKDDNTQLISSRYESYVSESVDAFKALAKHASKSFYIDADQDEHQIFAEILTKLSNSEKITHTLFYKVGSTKLPTKFGVFELTAFQNTITYDYHLVLHVGKLYGERHIPIRVHSSCITGDIFCSEKCDCGPQLHASLKYMQQRKVGALLYLFQEGRGINIINKIKAYELQDRGFDTVEANEFLNLPGEMRSYQSVKDILVDLGIASVDLLTNNPEKIHQLQSLGVIVERRIPLMMPSNKYNQKYLTTKKEKSGHLLSGVHSSERHLELETKYLLTDSQAEKITRKLLSNPEIYFEGEKYELTTNYDNKRGEISQMDARLRVRLIGESSKKIEKYQTAFKQRLHVGNIKKEKEVECEYDTGHENFIELLKSIGFSSVDSYERYRKTYIYNSAKITLDRFPFGYILEIEGTELQIKETVHVLGLEKSKPYPLSCDDVYAELCQRAHKKIKPHILFRDKDMPHL